MSIHPIIVERMASMLSRSNVGVDDLSAIVATKGDKWFVDGSKSASGDGMTWAKAFATITEAIAAASAGDTIFVGPGSYDEGAVLAVAVNNLKLIGSGGKNDETCLILASDASHHIMTIDASNIEICGFAFEQTNNTKSAIVLSGTTASKNVHIHDCFFIGGGTGKGEYGIACDATNDQENLHVENCKFTGWDTVALQVNATNALIEKNHINVIASKVGIEFVPDTGGRSGARINDNEIVGVNSSDVGIKITNTPDAGTYSMVGNTVLNCGTTITGKATNDAVHALNYTGSAAGGAAVDPSP